MNPINIKALIASKNTMLARCLPPPMLRWLERLIHQQDINHALLSIGDLEGLDFVRAALRHLNVSYTLHGRENIDGSERILFIANHPLGGLDGIILLDALGSIVHCIKAAVNDLLLGIEPMRSLFIPINKYGVQPRRYAAMLHQAYSGMDAVLYFPAGLCSRRRGSVISDPVWKHSAAKIACRYSRNVVPIYFDGRNSNTFYRLANLRTKLHIKVNLETFLLPRELFLQRGRHFNVYAGSPIPYTTLAAMPSFAAMTEYCRSSVYALNPH